MKKFLTSVAVGAALTTSALAGNGLIDPLGTNVSVEQASVDQVEVYAIQANKEFNNTQIQFALPNLGLNQLVSYAGAEFLGDNLFPNLEIRGDTLGNQAFITFSGNTNVPDEVQQNRNFELTEIPVSVTYNAHLLGQLDHEVITKHFLLTPVRNLEAASPTPTAVTLDPITLVWNEENQTELHASVPQNLVGLSTSYRVQISDPDGVVVNRAPDGLQDIEGGNVGLTSPLSGTGSVEVEFTLFAIDTQTATVTVPFEIVENN